MDKKINYLKRDFQGIKEELINFGKTYYPELTDNYSDASIMSWLIDMVAAVGDNLSYYTDRAYQSTNINSAFSRQALVNLARANGVKIPGPKASVCEVELSCTLPVGEGNISSPNWKYAPIIKKGSVVGNGSQSFEIDENVDFKEQFNQDGFSNRKYSPNRNGNGIITGYTISKTAVALGGSSKVYKKVLGANDVQPFMEIVLPEANVMNVESVIFKESSNFNNSPQTFEYYVDEEQFQVSNESVATYRYFEVGALTDQYRFGSKFKGKDSSKNVVGVNYETDNQYYEDYTETFYTNENKKDEDEAISVISQEEYDKLSADEKKKYELQTRRTSRFFKGEWKPITQKFITETTAQGFTKLIFGSGTATAEYDGATPYGEYRMSKIINNDMLGILPKIGWTMFVLYRTGGGIESNLAKGAVNSIMDVNIDFHDKAALEKNANDVIAMSSVMNSLKVTNLTQAVAGKDAPSEAEIRNIIKYAKQAQDRCVTIDDYKARIAYLPPKYGAPFRYNVIEDNNKVMIYSLGMNSKGKLDKALPSIMVDNMKTYLSHYKTLGDYIAVNSGKIYNIGVEIDLFVDKNYTTADVVKSVIAKIKDYFDVNNREMGEDIFIGDLEKEICTMDGVISIIELRVYNLYSVGYYSTDICPLPKYIGYSDGCNGEIEEFISPDENAPKSFRIGLEQIDNVLYGEVNSMYEILNDTDINVRVKLK